MSADIATFNQLGEFKLTPPAQSGWIGQSDVMLPIPRYLIRSRMLT
jgi:hypothetical protein